MNKQIRLKTWQRSFKSKWKYVLLVLPSLFFYFLFGIYPDLAVLPLSLFKWSPISPEKEFVGLHNYIMMFTVNLDKTTEMAINTLIYVGGLFVIQTVLALFFSVLLQKNTRKNTFFRAYFFLPMVFSSTMVSMTWNFMYDPNLGIINNILGFMGAEGYPGINFMDEGWKAIILIVLVHIWANFGYPLTILTSGLNTISGDLGEAAIIDGANSWQTFTHITFPLLLPTLFRMTLMTISTGVMATDYIYMMGTKESQTWASYMYDQTRGGFDYGMVSAAGVLMFVVLAITTIIQFVAMRKIENKVLG